MATDAPGKKQHQLHRSCWGAAELGAAARSSAARKGSCWWWCPSRRALTAVVCVAAALAAAVFVLGSGVLQGDEMPPSTFTDDRKGVQDIKASDLTADHLLDGLLTPEFSYRSCRSRYEFAGYHKKTSHKPSPYLIAKLRKQEALQKRCGPGTAAHKRALRRLESGEAAVDVDDNTGCRYVVYISFRGLGNRMLAIASSFLYAVLTERVLLVEGGKDVADLFCEPFPGTTWLLPRAGRRSPLRNLRAYGINSPQSLGNMLQSGAVTKSADGKNLSWSSNVPPLYVYLHIAGGFGFHDKLFYCGAQQELLRPVPWLILRADSYFVPGLFLTSAPFLAKLEAMFPEKDTAFYHLGRYLFHPTNPVWHAITKYYHDNLAGAGRRVGIQIRVFQEKQPPQQILDQLLSCIRREQLLPEATATNSSSKHSVLVTSLSSWYYEKIKDEYGGRLAGGGVHQPSHEEVQRSSNRAHNMRALSEMYLLSMSDVLVTSGLSTFGYVAQGLGGLLPWVMPKPNMWDEWKEGQPPPEPPCPRALSVEPCFHSPSYQDCAGRDVDIGNVRPYIKRCVDVDWGMKLINETVSQW